MRSINDFFTGSVMARLVTSTLLFFALFKLPIGYYKFLRWIVFSAAIYTAYISFIKNKQMNFGSWIFAMIAILFNPIIPFYMGKNAWAIADLLVGIIFCGSIYLIREGNPLNK
ncbi:MAG: hypothetical protein M0Q21_05855 [Ignavibacteriaceae bacterium]|nr:hypothetical protein [Ignavibacteriaceae bacterium]